MKRILTFLLISLIAGCSLFGQVGISPNAASPDPSAGLDVNFANKGFLPPRMTFEQRNAIQDPADGLMVYCTNCNADGSGVLAIFQGGKWQNFLFVCATPNAPTAGNHIASVDQIIWIWEPVAIAIGYKWNTVADYSTATDVGNATSITETELNCSTTYIRYVWAYNSCGVSIVSSLIHSTSQVPFSPAPTEGVHISTGSQIVWNWNPVSGASGYKWNTSNDFSTANDLGTNTSETETGLICGIPYTRYIWAYDICGSSSSTILTQSTIACPLCPGPITDSRDGKVYNTVLINAQCWMAQNLDIGTMIPVQNEQTNHGVVEKYCYNDDAMNCSLYGGIYQWDNMMQWSVTPESQGICPTGWHIPSDAEWTELSTYLGGDIVAGGKMKEAGTTHWISPNTGATNESGFNALPGGINYYRSFYALQQLAIFWSSSQFDNTDFRWYRSLTYDYDGLGRSYEDKSYGLSIRCIQD